MRITEVDRQVTQADIDQLEIFADRLFAKVGIDVEFTRHFLDRVNDERNVRQITVSELTRLFKQEFKKWGKKIAQLGPDAEAVMKDLQTDINMPFALRWDSKNNELDLIAKTVMRKNNFRTTNQEFPVESYTLTKKQAKKINESYITEQAMPKPNAGGILGTGLDAQQFQQRYGVTPKQATTSIGNVVKLRPGFQTPRVTNAITNFMLENPGSFQAANDNVKPNGFKLPSWLKGIAGRALGALGLIFFATPAGDPNEAEILAITNELHRWMMYNDPQALIDMYDAEWNALTDQQKKEMEQWSPERDPNYQQAKEAQRILDASDRYRDQRYNELLDRIYDPRNAQPEPAPEIEPEAPTAPEFDPANPDTTPPEDLPKPANDPVPPHRRPNTPGMPDPDVKPEFWPDDIPFDPPAPDSPNQPTIPAPDTAPDVEPTTDPDVDPEAPDAPADPGKETDPEVDPSTPVEPGPEVDPESPAQPQPNDPDAAPEVDPKTDPDPRRDAPGRTDPKTDPESDPNVPGKAPDTAPDAPAQPQPTDPDTAPDAEPTTDPDPRRDAPGKTDQPDPEKDPDAPGKAPDTAPDAPTQPQPSNPDTAPDVEPTTDPKVDPSAPTQPTQPGKETDPDPTTDPMPKPDVNPNSPESPDSPTGPDDAPNMPVPSDKPGPMQQPSPLDRPATTDKPIDTVDPVAPTELPNPITAPGVSGTPPRGNPPKGRNRRKLDIDLTGRDSDYDDPLQRWQRKYGKNF